MAQNGKNSLQAKMVQNGKNVAYKPKWRKMVKTKLTTQSRNGKNVAYKP